MISELPDQNKYSTANKRHSNKAANGVTGMSCEA